MIIWPGEGIIYACKVSNLLYLSFVHTFSFFYYHLFFFLYLLSLNVMLLGAIFSIGLKYFPSIDRNPYVLFPINNLIDQFRSIVG